jgi:DNA-binding NarL/FixJ family response regulator
MIRVLVVEDHPFVRDALGDFFAATGDIEMVDACADGSEVVPAFQRSRPDVVLMDLDMPQIDGLQASRALLETFPDARVLLHTGRTTATQLQQAHSLGVKGCVAKGDDPAELAERVRQVTARGTAVCSQPVAGPSVVP